MKNELNLSEKSKQIQKMFDKISKRYNFLNRLLSFGQDTRWRNKLLKSIPLQANKNGVLYDVACGTGDVILAVCKKREDFAKIIGFDISSGMLNQSKLRNCSPMVQHIQASAEHLPVEKESADCVTIAFGLRNVDNRENALKEFNRVLKKDGILLVLEFFPAQNSFFKNLFNFYFKKILPTIGGIFSDKDAYSYLPDSVKSMPSASEFAVLLKQNGFMDIKSHSWLSGSTMLFICRKN
jgi:demethylmenaquinone methyltransferase/2-methoxy-6-polyprenyl-1,4-benzoquinol methylase